MADFFDDKFDDKKEEEQELEKIKVGDTEFTADELNELIGKAKTVKEFEEKQGQSWDKVVESWGKRGERIGEYKKKIEEYEKELDKIKNPPPQEQIDREKLKEQVLAEAKVFGLLTKDEAQKMMEEFYHTRRSGERLLTQVNKTLKWAKERGYPQITAEKLLEYMADPINPKDPRNAYEIMFKKEIREVDGKKLESIKPKGMITQQISTAGSKQPKRKPLTKEDLPAAFREVLSRTEG